MAVKRVSLSGHKGSVKIADPNNPTDVVEVGSISNFELEIELNMEETPVFNPKGWMNHCPGMKVWSGSFEGFWVNDDFGQKWLHKALVEGLTVTLELYTNETDKYTGEAWISVLGVNPDSSASIECSFEFTGEGELQMPWPIDDLTWESETSGLAG